MYCSKKTIIILIPLEVILHFGIDIERLYFLSEYNQKFEEAIDKMTRYMAYLLFAIRLLGWCCDIIT